MNSDKRPGVAKCFLGIEAGGTRTVALLADEMGREISRYQAGPANLRLVNDRELKARLQEIADQFPPPQGLAIGMAGARVGSDFERIRRVAGKVWPGLSCYATDDLETGLAAADPEPLDTQKHRIARQLDRARVLVVSGTGSCCYAQDAHGRKVKVGGWGHILGDGGSGHDIGLQALRSVVESYDEEGHWPKLGGRILRHLQLNVPNDLIAWAQTATKAQIADLAKEVFTAWHSGDSVANQTVEKAANTLAQEAGACARRLVAPETPVQFVFSGSVLTKQPLFAALVSRKLRKLWPASKATPLQRESVWGAVRLAMRFRPRRGNSRQIMRSSAGEPAVNPVAIQKLSLTEQRNPLSMNLDRMSLARAIRLMLSEDGRIANRVAKQARHIEHALRLIVRSFQQKGRLFYVGAGTSGRLGVLDASECPPTFRTPPEMVQAIIAGGQTAIWEAVEGAEDDAAAGASAIQFRRVTKRDAVVGIAASGTTPFVWGAIGEAKSRGATTILICFNPFLKIPRSKKPSVIIAPNLGPELLTGSTRLKAGTATKMILNIFTTLAMVRIGKVVSNLMVDLNPSNVKLRDRAVRIVQDLAGVTPEKAREALVRAGWNVKTAIGRLPRRKSPRAS